MTDLLRLSSDMIDGNIELERAGPLKRIAARTHVAAVMDAGS